ELRSLRHAVDQLADREATRRGEPPPKQPLHGVVPGDVGPHPGAHVTRPANHRERVPAARRSSPPPPTPARTLCEPVPGSPPETRDSTSSTRPPYEAIATARYAGPPTRVCHGRGER